MNSLNSTLILFAFFLGNAVAFGDHLCSSQRTQFTITGQDLSSSEFQASASNPVATFAMYNYSPARLTSHKDINPWIGHSWGPGWEQVREQTYTFTNLIPGWRYHLNLKFWTKSVPSLNFSAVQDGATISQIVLDDAAMNKYWTISFTASQASESIRIRHGYAGDKTIQKYAYLDYLQILEQPCIEAR